jgi:hypothetical protein
MTVDRFITLANVLPSLPLAISKSRPYARSTTTYESLTNQTFFHNLFGALVLLNESHLFCLLLLMMWSSLTSKELHKSTDDFRSYVRR